VIIEIVPHNNKLTQNCSDLAGLFCRTKRYGFEYEILIFPGARHSAVFTMGVLSGSAYLSG
jgi:hypothetical protein